MDWQSYVKPEFLMLIPVLVFAGSMIKRLTKLNSKWIPLILSGGGILLVLLYQGAMGAFGAGSNPFAVILTAVIQGILAAASAVYSHQIYKQMGSDDKKDQK